MLVPDTVAEKVTELGGNLTLCVTSSKFQPLWALNPYPYNGSANSDIPMVRLSQLLDVITLTQSFTFQYLYPISFSSLVALAKNVFI